MSIGSSLQGFFRAFRRRAGLRRRPRHGGDALARTAGDSLNKGRSSWIPSSRADDQIARGADAYDASFDRD